MLFRYNTIENNGFKIILESRSKDLKLILVIWMFLDQNSSVEKYVQKIWRFHTPKIFRSMTRIMILAFQSVGNGNEEVLTLSFSLEVEDD